MVSIFALGSNLGHIRPTIRSFYAWREVELHHGAGARLRRLPSSAPLRVPIGTKEQKVCGDGVNTWSHRPGTRCLIRECCHVRTPFATLARGAKLREPGATRRPRGVDTRPEYLLRVTRQGIGAALARKRASSLGRASKAKRPALDVSPCGRCATQPQTARHCN